MFYFLLTPYNGPTNANYQDLCICLAEGFQKLDIPFTANIDYFPDVSGNTLFKKGDPFPYIITSNPASFEVELQEFRSQNKRIIVIDTSDEWIRHQSTKFIPICYRYLASTSKIQTDIIKPIVFGITNRMIEATEKTKIPWVKRSNTIVWCHRVSNHTIRNHVLSFYTSHKISINNFLDNYTDPGEHYWNHTGRRHSSKYYECIGSHKYIDAHGGYQRSQTDIVQWDSWKVWEGFLCGALVITADLDYYNIKLPFPLIPYVHYIPIRYHQMKESYDRLFRMTDAEKEQIAINGYEYAVSHYTPEKLAEYIISVL